jgi:hypothetical protein
MDRDEAQQRIAELVENFRRQQSHYESENYNETQCREDFINPLFTALGWDIENKESLSPVYRSVRQADPTTPSGCSAISIAKSRNRCVYSTFVFQ